MIGSVSYGYASGLSCVECWNTVKYTCQSWPTSCWAEWPFCQPYGIICFTILLIRQLYYFCNRFRSCVGATGGQWQCEHCLNADCAVDSWYSLLKHLSCLWKALQNLICYSWIFSVQLYVQLKKCTLKFKLLYLLNHLVISRKFAGYVVWMQSLKVRLKSILPWLKYRIFF